MLSWMDCRSLKLATVNTLVSVGELAIALSSRTLVFPPTPIATMSIPLLLAFIASYSMYKYILSHIQVLMCLSKENLK